MGKRLILTVHKNQYYTASALILRAVKEADIEFTAADGIHDDLLKYLGKDYENIYIIGSRLKADYAPQLKNAITALEKEKVNITFYLIGDRIEIKSPEVKFFMPYIKEAREGIVGAMITDLIKKDFEIPEADFQRINDIYKSFELKKYTPEDPQTEGRRKFVEYTYQMYFKWDVGDTSGLVDMIKKTAFDNAAAEEISRAKKYETSEYMLTGESKALAEIRKKAKIVGGFETPVLIIGETGTGKEYLARLVSEASKRNQKKFVAVNCAAINRDLMESTLFGHMRGSFTGAVTEREGVIKQAEGGTLFLDEITEMPLEIQ
ncbi:MAG TPA: sigma 54-interacting transcriptional regulator, partial [Candidatus Goldiibacteriota bacterium]|nr:sigma 54-interacting transcriptional regulator [Candidatus Goldiibacteriota bacterium]